MPREPLDTPTQRYKRQRALVAAPDLALAFVLSDLGLSHNIVRLLPDGSQKEIDPKWTLRQVEALYFIRYIVSTGRLTR